MRNTVTTLALALLLSIAAKAQSASEYFTVVLFGDPEINMTDRDGNNATTANMQKWVDCIINMHADGKGMFDFKSQPQGFVPKADLVICMGDMDKDSQIGRGDIEDVFDRFVSAGVPFVTMIGNHDVVPDYWNGGDKGVTWGPSGGAAANSHSFDVVNWYRDDAAKKGLISDLRVFTQSEGGKQAQPFTFMFRGVRFYIGQTYWFQKTYNEPSLFGTATYYAPNGIISDLTAFVEQNASTPSVWVQHYPINAADRWWDDTNANGASIAPKNTPDYATAEAKRTKYKELVAKTTNPYLFSGHQHSAYTSQYSTAGKTFTDYTAPYFATKGSAYIALCREGVGVVEVKTVIFDLDDPENDRSSTPVTAFSQMSNDKLYTLRTFDRGNLYNNGNDDVVRASGTQAYNPHDAKQQWAIINWKSKRYLYNMEAGKFASKTGNQLTLVDTPDANAVVTFLLKKNKEGYPWVLKFGEQYLNLSSGFDSGLTVDNWSTLDNGNQFAITEVGDFEDSETLIARLNGEAISTHDSRYTSAIRLVSEEGEQSVGDLQTAAKQKIKWDCTSRQFVCRAGETLSASVEFNGSWMNAYVYVDEDKNGFAASDSDIAPTSHALLTGTGIDLRSFSHYKGYNSLGERLEGGNAIELPAFQAPMTSGRYRMRYKVDCNSLEPDGNTAEDNLITANGGIVVDVTLQVKSSNDGITTNAAVTGDGYLYSVSGTRVPANAAVGRGLYILGGKKIAVTSRQ